MSDTQKKEISVSKGIVVTIIVMVIISALCAGVYYFSHSVDLLVTRAEKAIEQNRLDDACLFLERAVSQEENPEIQLMLADVYNRRGNLFEYEYLLRAVIGNPSTNAEQLEGAYRQLINRYKAQEDYTAIHDLLTNCSSDKIKSVFEIYFAKDPEFSLVPGKYDAVQTVKLTSASNCRIYYTTNGAEPSERSNLYTAPLYLDEGKTTVKAIAVNEYGIASSISEGIYQISIKRPDMPKLNVASGSYYEPIELTVLDSDEEDEIYYTTDGSVPDLSCDLYTKPIHVPLGDSTYCFVRIEDGRTSDPVKVQISFNLETEYTTEDAVNDVIDYYIKNKRIKNREGAVRKADYRYSYVYQYVQKAEDGNIYYFIAEYKIEADQTAARTGTVLAVDINTKDKFKVLFDEQGGFEIISIDTK